MAIKSIYNAADEIPEMSVRDLFEERNGVLHLAKIEGIKTDADVSRVSQALTNERNQHSQLKQQWNTFFGDRKPEEIQSILDRVPELEAAANGKMDDEKIQNLVEARLKTKLSPVERERDQLKSKYAELENLVNEFKSKEKQRTIHDLVRAAASKSKVIDTALEDVLMLAERVFEVNEDGSVTVKDGVGVTPGVTADIWLSEMQQKRPHWWPASQGGGAKGGSSAGGFSNNPWSAAGWNVTEQGRVVATLGIEKATQMALSAGSKIGAVRPTSNK